MCEPDPALTRAQSSATFPASSTSSTTSTCLRRRRLRRSEARPRRSHHHQSRRLVGETPAEGWTPVGRLTAPPSPRTRRTTGRTPKPRCPCTRHVPLRRCQTSSDAVPEVPYACWDVARPAGHGTLKANVLARARRGRRDGNMLLLTWLEVRACPAPRTVRCRFPPLQQKPWLGLSCSSTSLQRRQGRRLQGYNPEPHRLRQQ